MSRQYSDYYGDENDFSWAYAGHLQRTLSTKKTQNWLKELETNMLEMKERGEGRLLSGYLVANGAPITNGWDKGENYPTGVCANGIMKYKIPPELLEKYINVHFEENPLEFANRFAKALGISKTLCAEIAAVNDDEEAKVCNKNHPKHCGAIIDEIEIKPWICKATHRSENEEERFERVLKWVQRHIIREEVNA